ncbi:MotA/TolQ/ExbB proton channel family protein [Candidatus Neomarinimicrobiota bacterium]
MIRLMNMGGPFMWLLLIIAVGILALAIRKGYDLFGGAEKDTALLERGINAIIFWGILSAVVGWLGQLSGIYRSIQVIIHAEAISPPVIAQGFAISFLTTLFGLWIFLVAGIVWFVFRARYKKVASKMVSITA